MLLTMVLDKIKTGYVEQAHYQKMDRLSRDLFDILVAHSLVHLEPGDVAFGVLVLEPEVPGLAEADSPTDEVEKFLPGGLPAKAELKLGVHRRDLDGERLPRGFLPLEHGSKTRFDRKKDSIRTQPRTLPRCRASPSRTRTAK